MNGYCTIQINGQPVGLKFAYPAIKWFTEESINSDLYFLPGEGGGFTVEGLAKLIQCSYRNNCLIKEVEPELKFEDFFNWVEQSQETDEGRAELEKVVKAYADSSVMKKLLEQQKKSEANPPTST
jgi:hypothetical protein